MNGSSAASACRLLYLVGQLGKGGLERQLYYLLQGMDRPQYRPMVVSWNSHGFQGYASEIRALGVPVHCFNGTDSPFGKLFAFRRMVKTYRPEIVHSFSFYTNFAAHLATRYLPALPVGSLRSDILVDKQRVGVLLGHLSGRWPQHQVTNNLFTTKRIQTLHKWGVPKCVYLVRNAMDLHAFRECASVDPQEINIACVGSLISVKRWDRVLKAARQLTSRGYRCHIRIAGEGPLLKSLQDEANALGVQNHVTFLGIVTNIAKLISEASFLVHTSDTEGCPNVVMEAMACGRPVIAVDAGDVPHLVDHGQTGFIVEPENPTGLAGYMADLIDDPALCEMMGQRARAKAEREFGLQRLVEETLSAYRAAGWKG